MADNRQGLIDLGPAPWLLIADGALGRSDLDGLYRRHAPKGAPSPARLSRDRVVAAVVGSSLHAASEGDHDPIDGLIAALDKRARTEARLIVGREIEPLRNRLNTYGGLQFKKQRARMLWATLRHPEEPVRLVGHELLERLMASIAAGEDAVVLPRPSQPASARRDLPTPGGAELSAEIGKLRHSNREKQACIDALRKTLDEALATRSQTQANERRSALSSERKTQAEAQRAADDIERQSEQHLQAIAALETRCAELSGQLEAARQAAERSEKSLAEAPSQAMLDALLLAQTDWRHERQVLRERIGRGSDEAPEGLVVLFDVANLSAGGRAAGGKVDFPALLRRLAAGRPVRRAIAFAVGTPGEGSDRFENALRRADISVRWKHPVTHADGTVKADWDVALAVEALGLAGQAATVIIASGDGDFLPLVAALSARGTRTEAAGWPGRTQQDWAEAVDRFSELGPSDLLR
jgi:uncharacterized LabA/DUF88 family protein